LGKRKFLRVGGRKNTKENVIRNKSLTN